MHTVLELFDQVVIAVTAVCSFILLIGWFALWHIAGWARTERQRAYVLTLLSSTIMSIYSLPLAWQLWNGGFSRLLTPTPYTLAATTFFIIFLITDLIAGALFYKSQVQLLSGWIHHLGYIVVLSWILVRTPYCGIFGAMCILEWPTVALALGSIDKRLRHDYIFAALFVSTRIMFHGYAIYMAAYYFGVGDVLLTLMLTFTLHCYWFYGIYLGINNMFTKITDGKEKNRVHPAAKAIKAYKDRHERLRFHRTAELLNFMQWNVCRKALAPCCCNVPFAVFLVIVIIIK